MFRDLDQGHLERNGSELPSYTRVSLYYPFEGGMKQYKSMVISRISLVIMYCLSW